jgi:hypothetical protein
MVAMGTVVVALLSAAVFAPHLPTDAETSTDAAQPVEIHYGPDYY